MQKIGVDGERCFAALVLRDRDLVGLGEFDQLRPAGEFPRAPLRDDLDIGLERIIGELETDLIVAFAGGAVSHRVSTSFLYDIDLLFGDQRPRDGGAGKINAFVQRVGAKHRENVVANEFLAQVLDKDILGLDAKKLGLFASRRQLLALPQIGGEGDDFRPVGGLQPFEDDGRVEAAGIGEHNLFDGLFLQWTLLEFRGTISAKTHWTSARAVPYSASGANRANDGWYRILVRFCKHLFLSRGDAGGTARQRGGV